MRIVEKPLGATARVAAYTRVSTEKQEREGKSLRHQEAEIKAALQALGGNPARIAWYGQRTERGTTPAVERAEFMRLVTDIEAGRFDAVMFFNETRAARDVETGAMLWRILKEKGVRLFMLKNEIDLNNPRSKTFYLLQQTLVTGDKEQQMKSSFESRVRYARLGLPMAGRIPWGRCWVATGKETGHYAIATVDEDGKKIDPLRTMRRIANWYLEDGKTFKEIGVLVGRDGWDENTVRRRLYAAGCWWQQNFKGADPPIPPTKIPALLDEKTLARIKRKAMSNQLVRETLAPYMLNSRVRCGECGSVLSGHCHQEHGWRYYRHHIQRRIYKDKDGVEHTCNGVKGIPADLIENAIIQKLHSMYRNANLRSAIEAALESTHSGRQRLEEERKDLRERLVGIEQRRKNLIDRTADAGPDWKSEFETRAAELNADRSQVLKRLDDIEAELPNVEIPDDLPERMDAIIDKLKKPQGWSLKDKQALVDLFIGPEVYRRKRRKGEEIEYDEPRGIFVWPIVPPTKTSRGREVQPVVKKWRYEIRGALGHVPRTGLVGNATDHEVHMAMDETTYPTGLKPVPGRKTMGDVLRGNPDVAEPLGPISAVELVRLAEKAVYAKPQACTQQRSRVDKSIPSLPILLHGVVEAPPRNYKNRAPKTGRREAARVSQPTRRRGNHAEQTESRTADGRAARSARRASNAGGRTSKNR